MSSGVHMTITGGAIEYHFGEKRERESFSFPGTTKLTGLSIAGEADGEEIRVVISSGSLPVASEGSSGNVLLEKVSLSAKPLPPEIDSVFCNGFQSWTDSRIFHCNEKMKRIRPLAGRIFGLRNLGDYHFRSYPGTPGRFHSYTWTWFPMEDGTVLFIGSLSETEGYTIFDIDLKQGNVVIEKECEGTLIDGEYTAFSLFIGRDEEGEVFRRYRERMQLPERRRSCCATGWTSWYNYYTRIDEDIILSSLDDFASATPVPFTTSRLDGASDPVIFQIDDGFQKEVGDWLDIKPGFPRGMGFIADKIRDKGMLPGLWLAPFVCSSGSRILTEHPEWVLRDSRGKKVAAGWNPGWKGTFYALDIYVPSFREYLQRVFSTVFDRWGFALVKLDFLYAAAMVPNNGKSRGRIMAEAMELLREYSGDRHILGCGVPLGSALGHVDFCRIGSDVALKWEDKKLRFFRYRERVSTVNSLISTIGRRHTGNLFFGNDPDVFILRSRNCSLTEEQKRTLLIVNSLFGQLLFSSDNPGEYSSVEMKLYRSFLPHIPKEILSVEREGTGRSGFFYKVMCRVEERAYTVFINLSHRKITCNPGDGFWFSEGDFLAAGHETELGPYSSRVFLSIPSTSSAAVAGSDGHLFPGTEVAALTLQERNFTVELDSRAPEEVTLFLTLPGGGERGTDFRINGTEADIMQPLPGLSVMKAPVSR